MSDVEEPLKYRVPTQAEIEVLVARGRAERSAYISAGLKKLFTAPGRLLQYVMASGRISWRPRHH